ncbi:putative nuclease YhcG [Lachnospiraceae bacterium]|nr:putative nuclease YhcG [Lachnospiraceae bacterium]
MLITSNEYLQAVQEINDYVNQAKYRASVSVNSEVLKTNLFIGSVIIRNSKWGNKFVDNLSKDMRLKYPGAKGYSVRNLKYMKKFAQIFAEDDVDKYGLARITWSHHQVLMSKVPSQEEYVWYLEKTLEHGWSVDELASQVKSQLYERQVVANKISNFENRLSIEQKDIIISTMKDPYMFDFINYTEDMLETDIENELVRNVTSLLMELGTGFAFMGQQYHLEIGGKDFYIDLLFYNTKLRCYVAIDLKIGDFKPEQAGKMNFYLSALDDLVKSPDDNPSVGLILCRDENRTIAEYALRDMSKPIGVSEYHLCTDLPLDLKNALPDPEEIRSRIDMKK